MELSTTFTTTPKTVLQSYRACHRTAYVVRWVAAVGLVVLGIARADLVPVVVAIAFFAFAEWSVRRQLKPYLSGPRTVTVTITDEEYRTQGADRATATRHVVPMVYGERGVAGARRPSCANGRVRR
jgi:hypothetical protein